MTFIVTRRLENLTDVALLYCRNPILTKPRCQPPLEIGVSKLDSFKAFISNFDLGHLKPSDRREFEEILFEFQDVFSKDKYDVGLFPAFTYNIQLDKSKPPVASRQVPHTLEKRKALAEWVINMAKRNLIERSVSAWNSNIYLIHKNNSTGNPNNSSYRAILDGRDLGKQSIIETIKISSGLQTLREIQSARPNFISTLDFTMSFHHIAYGNQESKESTCFTIYCDPYLAPNGESLNGKWHFTRLSQGHGSSPFCLQTAVAKSFEGIPNVVAWIDDLCAFAQTFNEHKIQMRKILERCRVYNWKIAIPKCQFAKDTVEYIGFEISKDKTTPEIENIQALEKLQPPRSQKELYKVLGLFQFFAPVIPLFAQKSSQLSALLRKDTAWKGGFLLDHALRAFNELKNTLLHRPSIRHPNFEKDFQIHCDIARGSELNHTKGSMSAILAQCEEKDTYVPVGFWSRCLTDTETKMPSFLLEKIVVWKSFKAFYHYVYDK